MFYEGSCILSQMGEYVLSVISASVIVAIICSFFEKKSAASSILRLLCGIFITFVVINPLVRLDFSMINDYFDDFTSEGQTVAAMGENMAREAEGDIIKSRVQAYILDKAKSYGAQLNVEVILDRDNIPISLELEGDISPYGKAQLTSVITEDFGIAKEHQRWIG